MKRNVYQFEKDRFRKGKYSIYLRTLNGWRVISESYVFGVSKRYEAIAAVIYLNGLLNNKKTIDGVEK